MQIDDALITQFIQTGINGEIEHYENTDNYHRGRYYLDSFYCPKHIEDKIIIKANYYLEREDNETVALYRKEDNSFINKIWRKIVCQYLDMKSNVQTIMRTNFKKEN